MKLEVAIGNQQLAFLVIFICGVAAISMVGAYNPTGTGGNPAVMGHSADEVMVDIPGSGQTSLQNWISNGPVRVTTSEFSAVTPSSCPAAGCSTTTDMGTDWDFCFLTTQYTRIYDNVGDVYHDEFKCSISKGASWTLTAYYKASQSLSAPFSDCKATCVKISA